MPLVSAAGLTAFAHDILAAAGVPPHKAAMTADSLISANLRGVDSHGVQLLTYYIDQLLAGEMDPNTDGKVVSESGGCLLYDAANGLGQWAAEICCNHAIRLAREHGVSVVTARQSNHFGAAAWWAAKIRDAGYIGMAFCNASCLVPPWQGREPRLGTNPICMAVPGPWLLDMATTTVAAGKIFKARINGQQQIPAGWAFDSEGRPTTDTEAAYFGLLHPLGGYKGYGLAMMVEILCGVLSGGAMGAEVGGLRFRGRLVRVNQTYIAIDVARFMPLAEFTARMEKLVAETRSAAPAPGFDEVLVAGDPEWRSEERRRREGIPIDEGNWTTLCDTASRVGLAPPPLQ